MRRDRGAEFVQPTQVLAQPEIANPVPARKSELLPIETDFHGGRRHLRVARENHKVYGGAYR